VKEKDMTTSKGELRDNLYERDGHVCYYCGIHERDFMKLWGRAFYGTGKRGRRLEIDHKDAVVREDKVIRQKDKAELKDTAESCVLACALCNMAKSNMFTYEEFKKVGNVIREIWQERRDSGLAVQEDQD